MCKSISLPLLLALAVSPAACRKDAAPAAPARPASSAAPAAAAPVPAGPASLAGTVLETLNAASYTYLRLKTAGGETWAAVPQTGVSVGAQVTVAGPMPMDGFESKTLGRRFDRIVFGTLADAGAPMAAATAAAGPHGMGLTPAMPTGMGAPGMQMGSSRAKPPAELPAVKVERASGADGRTVAEVWAGKDKLKDKPVAVRGQVVKFTPGVLGKNWVHVRDGSGGAAAGDNDLTLTTQDVTDVGTVVTGTGVLRVDKDFGAGYSYKVIVEDAKLAK